eukprot:gene32111-39659_t
MSAMNTSVRFADHNSLKSPPVFTPSSTRSVQAPESPSVPTALQTPLAHAAYTCTARLVKCPLYELGCCVNCNGGVKLSDLDVHKTKSYADGAGDKLLRLVTNNQKYLDRWSKEVKQNTSLLEGRVETLIQKLDVAQIDTYFAEIRAEASEKRAEDAERQVAEMVFSQEVESQARRQSTKVSLVSGEIAKPCDSDKNVGDAAVEMNTVPSEAVVVTDFDEIHELTVNISAQSVSRLPAEDPVIEVEGESRNALNYSSLPAVVVNSGGEPLVMQWLRQNKEQLLTPRINYKMSPRKTFKLLC